MLVAMTALAVRVKLSTSSEIKNKIRIRNFKLKNTFLHGNKVTEVQSYGIRLASIGVQVTGGGKIFMFMTETNSTGDRKSLCSRQRRSEFVQTTQIYSVRDFSVYSV